MHSPELLRLNDRFRAHRAIMSSRRCDIQRMQKLIRASWTCLAPAGLSIMKAISPQFAQFIDPYKEDFRSMRIGLQQQIVNRGGGDGRLTHRNADLIQAAGHIACRVKPLNR